jgi:hypothetical protein
MDNTEPTHQEDGNTSAKPVEHNYDSHKQDPGPAPQAVNEPNDKGAGPALKWAIPIILVILFLLYFFLFRQ